MEYNMENQEQPIKRRRDRPRKNISPDMDKELNQQNLSAAENSVKATANSEKPANNIEIFVKNKIRELNLEYDLAHAFKNALDKAEEDEQNRVSLRVTTGLREFYKSLGGKMSTNMVKALEAMKVIYLKYFPR